MDYESFLFLPIPPTHPFTMAQMFDIAVVGLGVMGLSCVYQTTRTHPHLKVIGLEQYAHAHENGSSHGESRLTRQAYSEGAMYVCGVGWGVLCTV